MIERPRYTLQGRSTDGRAELSSAADSIIGEHEQALARTGFYGEQAAGCIPFALKSQRILLLKRSALVEEPGTWGNPGGAHYADEAPADAALRELHEETGYDGPVELHPARTFQRGSFCYSNFVAFVDDEFTPQLNWESDDFTWCSPSDLPEPLHFGLVALFGQHRLSSAAINEMHEHVSHSQARHSPSDAQREWLTGSQIVDANGEPLIAYHGTAFVFDSFDPARAGTGRGFAAERALFFSFDPWTATHSAVAVGSGYANGFPRHDGAIAENGGVVYPVYLRARSLSVSPLDRYDPAVMARHIEDAREGGSDALIFPHIEASGERGTIAVFSADQVRSIFDV